MSSVQPVACSHAGIHLPARHGRARADDDARADAAGGARRPRGVLQGALEVQPEGHGSFRNPLYKNTLEGWSEVSKMQTPLGRKIVYITL